MALLSDAKELEHSNAQASSGREHWGRSNPALKITCSEEISLLHDTQEFFLVDLAITITVSFINHFLQLFVGHPLPELLGHTLEILERDLSCLVIIKQTERLQDLIFGIAVQDLVGHHLQELLVLDGTTAIVVDVGDHLLNFLLLGFKAESAHGNFQLLRINGSRPIPM